MLDAAADIDTPLMQDPAFAEALRLCGTPPVVLPGGLIVLRRRVLGLSVAMLPRARPPEDLPEILGKAGLARLPLVISPERPCAVAGACAILKPRQTALLHLYADPDRQRAAAHGKWRNQLARAEDHGLRVTDASLPGDPSHPLLLAEAEQARTRGYANWPAALTAAFAAAAPRQTRLFRAEQGGRPVAQMLFLLHGNRATYHIGLTSPEGRAVNAHNLLLMRACSWLSARGCVSVDLGLLDPRTPDLNRFKLRSGAVAARTGGTWLRWRPLARIRAA